MLISDSYSDKTSSTLPIIISFSSQFKTKKIKRIREFLQQHPNCQKFVTKGPNFVADGVNEFRLYYVDSSLYADEITLKRLNVEKEEIMFGTTSEDSLEFSMKTNKKPQENTFPFVNSVQRTRKIDKATVCTPDSYMDVRGFTSVSDAPKLVTKVSKSFQIGPDLRFNVIYVNTDLQCKAFKLNTAEEGTQTEDMRYSLSYTSSDAFQGYSVDSSTKYQVRYSHSFSSRGKFKGKRPEKKVLTTFKDFYTRMEDKNALFRFSDDSEFNIESRTTSVKFSIKKSPPFVANYILKVLNTGRSSRDILTSEIYEKSIVNYITFDDSRRCIDMKKMCGIETNNKIVNCADVVKYDYQRKNKTFHKNHHQPIEMKKNKRKQHRRKDETNKNIHRKLKDCNKTRKYQNEVETTNRYKIISLFECPNKDFLFRKSHYAILKKYHKHIKEIQEKRDQRKKHRKKDVKTKTKNDVRENKNPEMNDNKDKVRKFVVNHYREIARYKQKPTGDSQTKTTISGFLQSYKPWHWQDNSKLSVCIDEECFTEDYLEDDKHLMNSSYQCKLSKIRKYFAL